MVTSRDQVVDLDPGQGRIDQFQVSLEVFQGPFDLLLQLISRKRLDITQVALAEVTDEFIAHMAAFPDLSRTTEFLVVAATLLDMKAARLLPQEETDEDAGLEDLEARDLLFSRLLQYRAFKEAAAEIARRMEAFRGTCPRDVELEPHFAALLPELVWTTTPEQLARLAAEVLSQAQPTVQTAHLLDPAVPVAGQARLLAARLRQRGSATFHELTADAGTTAVVVSRFLALLELFRRGLVEFSQEEALGELAVQWVGGDAEGDIEVDEYEGGPAGEESQG
ncbi:segregation and condensation protein A [Schaalia naturae]|uniref:Segregation and condensation protein A n=1 Tax=Schaalia naturae TaxID=635203 RepID=A0ABW2SJY0_9ACTO